MNNAKASFDEAVGKNSRSGGHPQQFPESAVAGEKVNVVLKANPGRRVQKAIVRETEIE